MKKEETETTGIILAGGQSRRMGYNKAMALIQGRPMIEWIIQVLNEVTPNIILSTANNAFNYSDLRVVPDIFPGAGPVGGIYAALKSSPTHLNLVMSCDMPFVPVPLLVFLIEEARKGTVAATLPVDENGQMQPLCAIYSKDILPTLHEALLQNNLKLKKIISETSHTLIRIDKDHPLFGKNNFLNINTPGALKRIKDQGNQLLSQ